ncbi:MAG: FecR domain-containing protein, partial [Brevinematales bacterium]
MTRSPLRVGMALGLLVILVGVGVFGMGWFFQYQKANKVNEGEAILVTMTIGDVQVRRMGSESWREVSVDEVVEMGDTLRTGNESACELQIVERGVYRLEANTEMLVAKLVNQEGNLQARIHVDKGTMGLKPKKLKEGEVFEVETSTAVAAVRGTVFMVSVTEEGDTRVAVAEGKVSVMPKVTAIEKAKEEARIDTKAYNTLQDVVAPAVEVGADEEVVLQKEVVEKVNQKVAEIIEERTTAGGPLTGEKVEEVKQSMVTEVSQEVTGVRSVETPSLVEVVFQKKEITEESKQILENVRQKKPVGKKRVKVSFSSDVPETVVVLNDLRLGKAPFSKILDGDATYTVVFEKKGYQSVSQEITITSPTNIRVKMIPLEASGTDVQEMVAQSAETNQQPEKPLLKPGEIEWEKPWREMASPTMIVVDRGGVDADRMVWSVENRIVIM